MSRKPKQDIGTGYRLQQGGTACGKGEIGHQQSLVLPARDTRTTEPEHSSAMAAMLLQPLCLQHTQTLQEYLVHGRAGGETRAMSPSQPLGATPASAQLLLQDPSAMQPRTCPLRFGQSTQQAADNSGHHISAIPQQGPLPPSDQRPAEAHASSPFAGSDMETKAGGCSQVRSSDKQDTKWPLFMAQGICNPPKGTAADSSPPDSADTVDANRNTTRISRAEGQARFRQAHRSSHSQCQ